MARLRTFIAVELERAIRDRTLALQAKLANTGVDVKWAEPENMHLTLLFLGEVEDREVVAVCRAVQKCCAEWPAFPMRVEKTGCFPNARRPRVVWVGIGDGAEDLIELHDALEEPLLELGCYRREDRPYTPHITLGRVKGDGDTEELTAALAKEANWQGGEMTVREVRVMSSELKSKGPEYTVLSRVKLS